MLHHQVNIELQTKDATANIKKFIQTAALTSLSMLETNNEIQLTVLLCDDAYMRNLNLTYRGIDKTTDVLSFEDRYSLPGSTVLYLGDIAISYPTAMKQTSIAGHDISAEISLLTVHGVLHLLGYDHQTIIDQKEMWSVQNHILTSLGYAGIKITEAESDAQK